MFVLLTLFLLTGCTPPPLQAERAVERGNEALLEGDLISAERHYREALSYEPLPPAAVSARNSVVHNNLGNAFYRQALWQDAQSAYEQALTTADRQQQAIHHYNLGNVFMQQVRSQAQSVQQLNRPQTASQEEDVSPEQLTAAAIANYQDALRRNPDDEDAKYNLELALQQNQQQNQQDDQQDDNQQQQDQQDEQEDENEDGNEGEQDEQQEQQDEGQDEQEDEGEQDDGQPEPPEPGDDEQPTAPPPLTQAQALQLLEAAAQQSDTLQEYLQRTTAPLPPPEQDW